VAALPPGTRAPVQRRCLSYPQVLAPEHHQLVRLYAHSQFRAEVRGRRLDLTDVVTVVDEIRCAGVPFVGFQSADDIAHLAAFGEFPGVVEFESRRAGLDLLKVGDLGRGVLCPASAAGECSGE